MILFLFRASLQKHDSSVVYNVTSTGESRHFTTSQGVFVYRSRSEDTLCEPGATGAQASYRSSEDEHPQPSLDFQQTSWDEFGRRLQNQYIPIFDTSSKLTRAKKSKQEELAELRQFSNDFHLIPCKGKPE